MSLSKEALKAKASKLRKQVAETEATLSGLKLQLAKIEAGLNDEPVPVSGLEILWKAALPIARNRSSKQQCRKEWAKIPKGERPPVNDLVAAIKIWNRCSEWKKDGNSYVPGLHKFIERRLWENLPEVEAAPSRYRATPKAVPQTDPSEAVTDKAEIAALLGIKPLRMNS